MYPNTSTPPAQVFPRLRPSVGRYRVAENSLCKKMNPNSLARTFAPIIFGPGLNLEHHEPVMETIALDIFQPGSYWFGGPAKPPIMGYGDMFQNSVLRAGFVD
jgi:hypothetical protein